MDVRQLANQLVEATPEGRQDLLAAVFDSAPPVGDRDEVQRLDRYLSILGAVVRRLRRHRDVADARGALEAEIHRQQERRDTLVLRAFESSGDEPSAGPDGVHEHLVQLLRDAGARLGLHAAVEQGDHGSAAVAALDVSWSWELPSAVRDLAGPVRLVDFHLVRPGATEVEVKAALHDLRATGSARTVLVDCSDQPGATPGPIAIEVPDERPPQRGLGAEHRREQLRGLVAAHGGSVVVWSAQDVVRLHSEVPPADLLELDPVILPE